MEKQIPPICTWCGDEIKDEPYIIKTWPTISTQEAYHSPCYVGSHIISSAKEIESDFRVRKGWAKWRKTWTF